MRPLLGEEEAAAAAEVVRSGWVAQGPRVAEFETAFAAAVLARRGVAVSSCTTGLHLMLHVLGLRPGDEVVVPSFSFIATANAVRYTGAMPVFADVDPVTGNLSSATVEPVLTSRTRAVLAVHQGGVPADVAALRNLAGEVPVLEDAACAAGSTYRGRPVGAGDLLGQRRLEDGHRLPQLHRAALELAQHLEQMLGGALLDLGGDHVGGHAGDALAESQRRAPGEAQRQRRESGRPADGAAGDVGHAIN